MMQLRYPLDRMMGRDAAETARTLLDELVQQKAALRQGKTDAQKTTVFNKCFLNQNNLQARFDVFIEKYDACRDLDAFQLPSTNPSDDSNEPRFQDARDYDDADEIVQMKKILQDI